MKKIAVFLAVLLLLAAPVLAAEPTEALSDVLGADELTQSLPDEAAEVLDGLSPDGMPDFRSGVRSILRAAAGGSGGALRSGLRLCAVLLAMVTLCAVVHMSAQKDPVNAVSAVGALGICAACLGGMQSMISLASETVTRLSDYSACLLPVNGRSVWYSGFDYSPDNDCSYHNSGYSYSGCIRRYSCNGNDNGRCNRHNHSRCRNHRSFLPL